VPNVISINEVFKGISEDDDPAPVVLLGEYGFGKTSSALTFACELAEGWESGQARAHFPILMNLRGIAPGNLNPSQLLASWSADKNVSFRALLSLIRRKRAIIICDAFDEMPIAHSRDARKKNMNALLNLHRSTGAKLVMTGRANAFDGYNEILVNVGHRKGGIQSPEATAVYTLERFNTDQIKLYCAKCELSPERVDAFIAAVHSSEVLRDVLTRPVLLVYAVALLKHGALDLNGIVNSADLLGKFIDLLSSIHEEKKVFDPAKSGVEDILSSDEREFFTLAVAAEMSALERNYIRREELEKIVERSMALMLLEDGTAVPLSERVNNLANPVFEIASDVLQRGVLSLFEQREAHFSFGHKSFYDYFRAKIYTELTGPIPSRRSEAIVRLTEVSPELLTSDEETLRLVVELEEISNDGGLDSIARRLLRRELGASVFSIQRALVVNSVIWLGERWLDEVREEVAFSRSPLYVLTSTLFTVALVVVFGTEMAKPTSLVAVLLVLYCWAVVGGSLLSSNQRRIQRWVRLCEIGGVSFGARAAALGLRYFGPMGAMKLGLRLRIGGYRKRGWAFDN
jgi:hypothetical protein